jgi:SAM-dependent methyltransferase
MTKPKGHDLFRKISDNTVNRYSNRFLNYGPDVRSLGWGSIDQQRSRFSSLLRLNCLENNSILDIGCGFADLYKFIVDSGLKVTDYQGWDINPEFIRVAQENNPFIAESLTVKDILFELPQSPVADIGVMLGLLNYKYSSFEENMAFSRRMISNAFECVSKALCVDFISSFVDPGYPMEDFIFYHNPADILSIGLSLTSNVVLIHDYEPIPQKEFTLVLYK